MMFIFQDRKTNRVWGRLLLAALSVLAAHGGTILGGSADTTVGTAGSFNVFGSDFSIFGTGGVGFSSWPFVSESGGVYSFIDTLSSEQQANGITGSYTVAGQQYPYSCNQGPSCGVVIDFAGTFTVPGGLPAFSTVTVTTPFTAQGNIGLVMIGPGVFAPPLSFSGGGIATIKVTQFESGTPPVFGGGTYTFVATPEPSAMSLMGFGLLAVAIGAHRHHSKWMIG